MAMIVSMMELAAECGVTNDVLENELDSLAYEELGSRVWKVPGNAARYVAMDTDEGTFLRLSAALKLTRRILGPLEAA